MISDCSVFEFQFSNRWCYTLIVTTFSLFNINLNFHDFCKKTWKNTPVLLYTNIFISSKIFFLYNKFSTSREILKDARGYFIIWHTKKPDFRQFVCIIVFQDNTILN